MGVNVELIQRKDFGRLAEYDALLIRETTRIGHHTFRFAKKADSGGMVVIDDPDSILRCTNKVLGEGLYRAIIEHMMERLEQGRSGRRSGRG